MDRRARSLALVFALLALSALSSQAAQRVVLGEQFVSLSG